MHPKDLVDYKCKDCSLWKTRIQVVWGDGDPLSRLCFIGEGPGREEDETGVAFIGKAGRFLRKILKLLGLKDKVLILNLVKCRPPKNRPPKQEEVDACNKYLVNQLQSAPNLKLIVALGRVPWKFISGNEESVKQSHGRTEKHLGHTVLFTYHPSFLSMYKDKDRIREFISDIKKAKALAGVK